MKTFIMCKGLPASGKSTWAEQFVLNVEAGSAVRVNMDLLRTMLNADRFKGNKTERFVQSTRDAIIQNAMEAGKPFIISDDTNLNPKCEVTFREFCETYGYQFKVQDFTDRSLETCIARDLKRTRSVGQDVIMRMYDQYLRPAPEVYTFKSGLPSAIIVDIDGTLAHMVPGQRGSVRSPYDYERVLEDQVDPIIAGIVNAEAKYRKVIVMSGRDDDCKDVTERWLQRNGVSYDEIYMRAAGDKRKDSIVKRELFDQHVRDRYNVLYVLDDRNQVVEEWRRMGLKCLQVAPGAF